MTKSDAKDWVEIKLSEMLEHFGSRVSDVSRKWHDHRMSFQFRAGGIASFHGTLTVTDNDMELILPFPLLAKGFEAKAKAEAEKWLGENLPKS